MLKFKKIIILLSVVVMSIVTPFSVCASFEPIDTDFPIEDDISVDLKSGLSFTVDDNGYYDDAILLSEETVHNTPNIYETIRTYKMPDETISKSSLMIEFGSDLNDSLSVLSSTSGSISNAVYKQEMSLADVTIIASFDWYTEGAWSYVQCSNMTAYYSAHTTQVACDRFNKSKSDGYIKSGKAWAKVDYLFYNKYVPGSGRDGTFKVSCSDNGKVS